MDFVSGSAPFGQHVYPSAVLNVVLPIEVCIHARPAFIVSHTQMVLGRLYNFNIHRGKGPIVLYLWFCTGH